MDFELLYSAPADLSAGAIGAAFLGAILAVGLVFLCRDRYIRSTRRLQTSLALALTALFAAAAWGGTAGLGLRLWGNLLGVPGAELHGLLGSFELFLVYPTLLAGPAIVLAAGFVPESPESLRKRWWLPAVVAPVSGIGWAWYLTSQPSFCAVGSTVDRLAEELFTWVVAAATSLGCGFTLSEAARKRSAASSVDPHVPSDSHAFVNTDSRPRGSKGQG